MGHAPYYDTALPSTDGTEDDLADDAPAIRDATPMITRLLSLDEVTVIAHRGGSKLRPENTMAAFDHAASLGVDGIECDVHLAADGVPVVIHDPTLDRTTDSSGPVAARTSAELARVDAGYQFGPSDAFPFRGVGLGVPRLIDVLERHATLPCVIEIKGSRHDAAARVLEVVDSVGARERVIIGAFTHRNVADVRRLAPTIPTSASGREVRSALWRSRLFLAPRRPAYRLVQAPYRLAGRQVFGRRFVRAVRRAQIPFQAWIIDTEQDMTTLLDWGVTGLISDRPDTAMRVVAERAHPPDPSIG